MDVIIKRVSEFTGVTVDDICSRKRTHAICEARQIFVYLTTKILGTPLTSIAKYLNGRSHQTLSEQMINFEQQVKIYKGLNKSVNEIRDVIIYCQ